MTNNKKWEEGQDRFLVVDMRDGQPNRRRFFTIEAPLPNRHVMRGEVIFCQYEADRDYILATTARAEVAEADAERLAGELSLCIAALKKLDDFKPYPGCANPFAEVIVRAKAALAAHDGARQARTIQEE